MNGCECFSVCKLVEGSHEMSDSLVGLKSVTYAVVIILFVLLCIVDKRVVQLSMLQYNEDRFDVNVSESLDTIDAQPLVITEQSQVLSLALYKSLTYLLTYSQ